ncbi:hypothetical protein A2U01_0109369, partial [Trifolium medium]|nr:hypothetical protein [Trifolium medium]
MGWWLNVDLLGVYLVG